MIIYGCNICVRIEWIWAASKIRQKLVSIEYLLKSWNIEYIFKWNQIYLSGGLNLSRRPNSLNSASGWLISNFIELFTICVEW